MVVLLVGVAVAVAAPPVEAKRGGPAAASVPKKVRNMPPGWSWPPTEAMLADGRRCLEHLDRLGIRWQEGPPTRRVTTPVVIPEMKIGGVTITPLYGKPPYVVDCHLVETLAIGAVPVLKAAGVAELRVTSLYANRNLRGRRIMSRHAAGLAADIYEFVTTDGKALRVKAAYWARGGALRTIERGLRESGLFRGPLTPGNDRRGHDDHFHLEARTPPERRDAPAPNT